MNDGDQPATKKDLNDLRSELHGDMDQLRTESRGDMDRLREELVEKMRDMQTEVLRAFHGWASPIEIRLRALPNMEERLVLLEERVSTIERRNLRTSPARRARLAIIEHPWRLIGSRSG
jgi:hypothetical protein